MGWGIMHRAGSPTINLPELLACKPAFEMVPLVVSSKECDAGLFFSVTLCVRFYVVSVEKGVFRVEHGRTERSSLITTFLCKLRSSL